MLTKVYDALEAGRTCDGHGAVLDNIGLDVYGTIRIKRNDHRCGDANGMKEDYAEAFIPLSVKVP